MATNETTEARPFRAGCDACGWRGEYRARVNDAERDRAAHTCPAPVLVCTCQRDRGELAMTETTDRDIAFAAEEYRNEPRMVATRGDIARVLDMLLDVTTAVGRLQPNPFDAPTIINNPTPEEWLAATRDYVAAQIPVDTRSAAWQEGYDAAMAAAGVKPPPVETRVNIPGEFTATYVDGVITSMVWMPHLDPACEVFEGDKSLDTTDVDGPFWKAMQTALAADLPIKWEE